MKTQTEYFLGEFHQGTINRFIHLIGLLTISWGVYTNNIPLIIISPFIMECGHLYNMHSLKRAPKTIQIIPIQWIAWGVLLICLVGLNHLLHQLI
jgi:hypothetical protein